jgi:hypothetical protein
LRLPATCGRFEKATTMRRLIILALAACLGGCALADKITVRSNAQQVDEENQRMRD